MLEAPRKQYSSYTINTYSIVDWLAETAIKHGYPPSSLADPSEKSNASGGKKNGEAKSGQRREGRNDKFLRAYNIGPSAWVSLAEHISKIPSPSFTVPRILFIILEETILLREEIGATYTRDPGRKHAFAITQLKHIREILLPRQSPTSSLAEDDAFKEILKRQLQDARANELKAKFRDEEHDSFQDHTLGGYYLILDILEIRNIARNAWYLYAENAMELVTATLATNFAIALVREMEADHDAKFPRMCGYEAKTMPYFFAYSNSLATEMPQMEGSGQADPLLSQVYDIGEDIMINCYLSLKAFTEASSFLSPSREFQYMTDKKLKGRWARASLTNRQKLEEDDAILTDIMRWFLGFLSADHAYPDELINAYKNLVSGKEISLWEVFAFQVYLDGHHRLGIDYSRPYTQLKAEACLITKRLEKHEAFCKLANQPIDRSQTQALRKVLDAPNKKYSIEPGKISILLWKLTPMTIYSTANLLPPFSAAFIDLSSVFLKGGGVRAQNWS
ncbi:hypothetical protein DRE_00821 [Drechslerella stenobrocha 248]|uniref:DUF6604 domain-containing protein n=1 Tax=Drechslerella stenobrocha 248 TaxID=1043628 RepID=W7HZ09_9PEZI|nr:hypothetical protein DRE_00821 [Drechslerella stenobrocha 248]